MKRALRNPGRVPNGVRTTVTLTGSLSSAVAAAGSTLTYADIQAASDFTAFSGLYRDYRVVGLEIEIFDALPTTSPVTPLMMGTHHTGGTLPTPSLSLVQDLPDSQNIPPFGRTWFYWRPTSPSEKLFLPTGGTADYGGLVTWCLGGAVNTGKWRYLARAVVEFKDRI